MTGPRRFRPGDHPDELLSASLSGDLSAAERAAVERHLAGCARCRATLAGFSEERRLVAGLRHVPPPRDMAARVRAGIEAGEHAPPPRWRRPSTLVGAFASVATMAAAVLAVLVLSDIPRGPVASTTEPTPTLSVAAASVTPTPEPQPTPDPTPPETVAPPSRAPQVALGPGELGYLLMESEPEASRRLFFVKDSTGEALQVETPSGPPITAAISPTGEWLAYITEVGGAGVNQVWLLHLTDGSTQVLGCTAPHPFTERLAWSDDGKFLAYTLAPVELNEPVNGAPVDCAGSVGDGTAVDAWAFETAAEGRARRVTDAGNAYAGDFLHSADYGLLVSYAQEDPYTRAVPLLATGEEEAEPQRTEGAFLPLLSPDGNLALFWRGRMERDEAGAWRFARGGMPYVTAPSAEGGPSWDPETAQPLFADLEPVGGAGFESGRFAWGDNSDVVAFWLGAWTGTAQDGEGRYPNPRDVYAGQITGGRLTAESRLPLDLSDDQRIVAVAVGPAGVSATVTVAQPVGGVEEAPTATLYDVPINGGVPNPVGGGQDPLLWNGPALYGEEAVPLPE